MDDSADETPRERSLRNLKPFAKGQSGNPKGAPKQDAAFAAIKKLTQAEMAELGSLVVKGTLADLQKISTDPDASVLKVAVASIAAKAIKKGDMHALDLLLNRLIGKVKDQFEHSGIPPAPPAQVVITLPSNGREKPSE